ncbi:MAG: alpha-galactosidase [Clostridia bacterium]|nr:alpha-galactosidase [Clostridia bacterium]
MSKRSLNLAGEKELYALVTDPASVPVSFLYGGKAYRGLGELPIIRKEASDHTFKAVFALDEAVELTIDAAFNREYGEVEYTLYFENVGDKPSYVLEKVVVLDHQFMGDSPILRGCLGDHENYYAAYEHDLLWGDKYFRSTGGRATHIVFPYFDLVHGDGGTLIALGWAGTWDAMFAHHDGGTTLRASTDLDFRASLLPGEKVRSGLVVMLPYKGRDADFATNLWREWFMKYNLPKKNAAGDPLEPFSTAFFANDTGLPNSDGSISERSFTWKPSLEKLIKEDMLPDFRWFDAGWYPDPAGNTVETDWWGTVGVWEIDHEKWPGDSFRESCDAFHDLGIRTLVWFEPERVTHVDDLVKNHGYKREWALGEGRVITNNIGDPECLKWTTDRIIRMLDENHVDMFREDNNSDPAGSWPMLDKKEEESLGLPRRGIAENKCICGHYAMWDTIIKYCGENGKCTFVDSCASGGGRNDIESMRRAFPLMRSDYDRTTSAMRLSQTSSFCKWIPFHGSTIKETATQLEASTGAGSSPYVTRASFLPIYNYGEAYIHNPDLDYDLMRRNYNEWKSVRHLLTRDFYALTPWHHENSRTSWTAFAYDAPERGESLLLVFRMEEAEAESYTAKLKFAEDDKTYLLTDADTGKVTKMSGKALKEQGYTVSLKEKKTSALIRIKKA